MMHSKDFIKMYQTKLGIFPTKEHRMIAKEILCYLDKNKNIAIADFITYAETTNLKQEIMDIINSESEMNLTDDGMMELIEIVQKKIKKAEITRLKEEIKKEYDVNKKVALIERIAEIKKGSVNNESN